MSNYALEKIGIPIVVGLAVLIVWKYNTKRAEKKKVSLPLLNEFSKSLAQLRTLIDQNYPYAMSKDTSTSLLDSHKTSAEFVNLPKKIRRNLIDLQKKKSIYLNSLNLLLNKVAPLESYVQHRQHNNNLKQLYIVNFILLDEPPSEDVVINFPMQNSGGFHSLFCDKSIAIRIYNEAIQFGELKEYKENKFIFEKLLNTTLSRITKLQNV